MTRVLVLLTAALLLVGCGGGDDGEEDAAAQPASADGSGEEEGTTTSTTAAPADDQQEGDTSEEEDQAIADGAVLQLSDFEPGWRADEPEDDEDDEGIRECEGFEAFDDDTPSADSMKFVRDQAEVESSVAVLATEADAEEFMELFVSESTVECLRERIQEAVDAGFDEDPDLQEQFDGVSTTIGQVSVGEHGDDAAGYQIEATFEGPELTLDAYFDLLVVRQGRALAVYTFTDVFSPFAGDRDSLVQAVVDRLVDAGL